MTWKSVRNTRNDRVAAGIRIGLGVVFLMTGVMKVVVPTLGAAFAGQLAAANIPFQDLNRWVVPFVEIAIGGDGDQGAVGHVILFHDDGSWRHA